MVPDRPRERSVCARGTGGCCGVVRTGADLGADRIPTIRLLVPELHALGRYDREFELLEELLKEDPHDASVLLAKAEAISWTGKPEKAIEVCEAALGEGAEPAPSAKCSARRCGATVTTRRRSSSWSSPSRRRGDGVDRRDEGQILNALGNREEEAVDALRRAVELDPTLDWPHTDLGYILIRQGKYAEANAGFDRALALREESYAFAGKGQSLRLLGKWPDAIEPLRRAVEMDPSVPSFHAELGEVLRVDGRYDEARRELELSLQQDPGYTWAGASLAATLYKQELYDEALEKLDEVIAAQPDYAFALGTRGEIRIELAEWKEAVADLTRAAELDDDNDWFYGLLGGACEYDNRPQQALEAYDAALELTRDSPYWRAGRGEALLTLGDPGWADEFTKVIDQWKNAGAQAEPGLLAVVGWCYYRLGEPDKAVRRYKDELGLNPDSAPTQFDLALLFATTGREPLAVSEYERGVEMAGLKPQRRRRGLSSSRGRTSIKPSRHTKARPTRHWSPRERCCRRR